MRNFSRIITSLALIAAIETSAFAADTLLNVSSDATREFFQDVNKAFGAQWKTDTGQTLRFRQSHGGSGKQTRAVIDGLEADVVTLAVGDDVDALHNRGNLVPKNWRELLPHNSSPYTSTIVFVVRKGNPDNIKTWDDLIRDDVDVITPSPKTSGGARLAYLAIWGYALKKFDNDETKVRQFVQRVFANVPVLDSGARGSTSTFAQRNIGDVLVTWENEAHLTLKEFGPDKFEIVVPPISILAEPPVAVVKSNTDKKGTTKAAEAYLRFLYTPKGQELAAKHFFRPRLESVKTKYASRYPAIELFTVDEVFGGWPKAQKTHFSDGGTFDQIYSAINRSGRR